LIEVRLSLVEWNCAGGGSDQSHARQFSLEIRNRRLQYALITGIQQVIGEEGSAGARAQCDQ
jgi:hypothetical protein